MRRLANETRFILAVVGGELAVSNRKKADIVADLAAAGYDRMPPSKKVLRFLISRITCKQPATQGSACKAPGIASMQKPCRLTYTVCRGDHGQHLACAWTYKRCHDEKSIS